MIELLELRPLGNVVVIRSLSKILGVPGLRIGFVYSTNSAQLAAFRDSLPIWNMNSIAEKFIELLLKNRTELEASFSQTRMDRDDLERRLRDVPAVRSVWPSGANFLLVELGVDRAQSKIAADDLLSSHGIYVKEVSSKFRGSLSCWRLAVRTLMDHERLLQAMESVFSRANPVGATALQPARNRRAAGVLQEPTPADEPINTLGVMSDYRDDVPRS